MEKAIKNKKSKPENKSGNRLKKKSEHFKEIENLVSKAEKSDSKKKADRNIRKTRNIAMKHRIKIPKEIKIRYCKHCNSFLKPGENCRIRIGKSQVVYYCMNCKKYMKFPYKKEQKQKREESLKKIKSRKSAERKGGKKCLSTT